MSNFAAAIKEFLSTPSARRATQNGRSPSSVTSIFLSTPSARRATMIYVVFRFESKNFYPRPPRGGRRCRNCFSVPS